MLLMPGAILLWIFAVAKNGPRESQSLMSYILPNNKRLRTLFFRRHIFFSLVQNSFGYGIGSLHHHKIIHFFQAGAVFFHKFKKEAECMIVLFKVSFWIQ